MAERNNIKATVNKEIRAELKKLFPGIKFRISSTKSVKNIEWTDGPTKNEVKNSLAKFIRLDRWVSDIRTFRTYSDEAIAAAREVITRDYSWSWELHLNDYMEGCYSAPAPAQPGPTQEEIDRENQQIARTIARSKAIASQGSFVKPYLMSASLADLNKNNSLDEYTEQVEQGSFQRSLCLVVGEYRLTSEDFEWCKHNLIEYWVHEKFSQWTGTGSVTFDGEINTESDRLQFVKGSYDYCLAVIAPNGEKFLINPQGFNYARYALVDATMELDSNHAALVESYQSAFNSAMLEVPSQDLQQEEQEAQEAAQEVAITKASEAEAPEILTMVLEVAPQNMFKAVSVLKRLGLEIKISKTENYFLEFAAKLEDLMGSDLLNLGTVSL